jgi:hypothetical protein
MTQLTTTTQRQKDLLVLLRFMQLYCRLKHANPAEVKAVVEIPQQLQGCLSKGIFLCPDCTELAAYAMERLCSCPLKPKPSCKHCHIHCYGKEQRAKIREIMAFSGKRMLLRGRIDYLWHYFS